MKTYQIEIDDKLFPELKRILKLLPQEGVKLYNQNGYEIQLDTSDLELTDELRMAIDEGIAELDRGEGISNENVLNELHAKYPEAHQNLVLERFEKTRENPDRLLDWNEAKKTLND